MQSPLVLLWVAVVVFALTNYMQRADLVRRIRHLEGEVRALRSAAGLPESGGEYPEVLELVRAGRRIDAIKLYRQRTGATLKESKDAVDAMEGGR